MIEGLLTLASLCLFGYATWFCCRMIWARIKGKKDEEKEKRGSKYIWSGIAVLAALFYFAGLYKDSQLPPMTHEFFDSSTVCFQESSYSKLMTVDWKDHSEGSAYDQLIQSGECRRFSAGTQYRVLGQCQEITSCTRIEIDLDNVFSTERRRVAFRQPLHIGRDENCTPLECLD